jgi:HEAT repeat protein
MRSALSLIGAAVAIVLGALLGWCLSPHGRDAPSAAPAKVATSRSPETLAADSAVEAIAVAIACGEPANWEALVAAADERVADVSDRSAFARAILAVYARDETIELRAASLVALEHLGGAEGVRALADIARRDDDSSSLAAMRLSRIDDLVAGDALVDVIESQERRGEIAASALRALGKTRSLNHARFVAEMTKSSLEPRVRREAAEALGKIADPDSIDTLAPLLGDADRRVRLAAIRAIGRIRAPTSRALLDAHLESLLVESRRNERGLAREIELTNAGLMSLGGQLTPGRPG